MAEYARHCRIQIDEVAFLAELEDPNGGLLKDRAKLSLSLSQVFGTVFKTIGKFREKFYASAVPLRDASRIP
jgi:hypothetical protein